MPLSENEKRDAERQAVAKARGVVEHLQAIYNSEQIEVIEPLQIQEAVIERNGDGSVTIKGNHYMFGIRVELISLDVR